MDRAYLDPAIGVAAFAAWVRFGDRVQIDNVGEEYPLMWVVQRGDLDHLDRLTRALQPADCTCCQYCWGRWCVVAEGYCHDCT